MNTLQSPRRVLHIVSTMDRGGAESLIMNIYRNIDRRKLQFDFVAHGKKKGDYDEEINALGGHVFAIPSLGEAGLFEYIKSLKKIISDNNYTAIHAHTDYQSGVPALAARLSGIQKRICHSHSNNWPRGNGYKDRLILTTLQAFIKLSATTYCSCSKEAGEFLFGKRLLEKSKVSILNNGIDVKQFLDAEENAKKNLINELHLPINSKLLGHVGRFSESKNQMFILKLLQNLLEKDKTFVAILVGDGPLKKKVEEEARNLEVTEHIRFLGVRDDIPPLMKAFDVFLFPSLFEGFGIVVLEAQAAGTPCVLSDRVPKTTDMGLDLVSYMSLDEEQEAWSREINRAVTISRPDGKLIEQKFYESGFCIKENVDDWLTLYGVS